MGRTAAEMLEEAKKRQNNKINNAGSKSPPATNTKVTNPPATVTAPPTKVVITPPVVTPSPVNSPNAQYWNGPVTNNMPVAPVVAPPPVKDNTETVTVAPLPERSYNQFETSVSKPSPSHTAPENNAFQKEYKEYVEAVTEPKPKPEPSDDKVIAPPLPERGYDQFETFKNGGATSPEPKAPPAVKESPVDSPTKDYWSEPITEQLPPPTEPKQPEIDPEELYFAVKYEGLGHDELVGRYNELYEEYATTGNVGLIPELNFLSKRAEETQSPVVLAWKRDKAIDNAQGAYNEYEGYMYAHNSLYGPDDNSTSSTRKGEAKYNAYKNFNAEASRYEYLYRNALKNEIAEEYEVPAMESPSFEVHSKFDENQLGGDYKDVNTKPDDTDYFPSTNVNSFVTDEERAVYNFWTKINPTKADEYLEALEPLLKKRMTEFNSTLAANHAKDHPVAASIEAFLTKLDTLPMTAAYTFASNLAGKYDPDSRILQNRIYANALQSNVSQNINNPVGSFIYDNGISIAESATYAALFGPYAVYFLGASAAVDKARDTALNGGNDAQILLSGIAAGAAEVIFEKVGFDNLFKAKSVGNLAEALQTTLKQSGIEMGEEFCTSLASIVSDNFVMGGKSEYNRLVEEYVDNGYSRSEARSKAIVDMGGEVFIETLAGAFSGSVFGAVDAGARYVNASGIGNETKNNGSINEIVNAGKKQPETSSAFERAGRIENSKNPSNAEVGALVQQMVIDGQITQEEAQELVSGDKAMPENAQAYYYAGANGLSFSDAVDSNPNIVINPDTAYDAWKAGKDLSENKKVETKPAETTPEETTVAETTPEEITPEVEEVPEVKTEPEVIPSSEKVAPEKTASEEVQSEVKEIPETEATPETKAEVVKDVKTKEETPEAKAEVVTETKTTQSPVIETSESKPTVVETKTAPTAETEGRGNEYVKAAAEHRTEENKESFDVAYDLGLTGRDITELPLPGISADDAVKAWVAGKTDRANLRATSTEGMPTKTVSPVKETVSTKEVTPVKKAEVVKTTPIKETEIKVAPEVKAENGTEVRNSSTVALNDSGENKIVNLKHNKNVYSLFKGAKKIFSNKDFISDAFAIIPFSEEALEKVKNASKKSDIENNFPISPEKVYNINNDVVIQGEPKIWKDKLSAYVFNINGTYYAVQQKYIDTFNNGKNVIKANSKTYSTPWTVHDEKGNFVAAFMPMNIKGMTDEKYAELKKVSEVKATPEKKAETKAVPKAKVESEKKVSRASVTHQIENAGKNVEAERAEKKSDENKIYPGMSDSERAKIIANKRISLVKAKDTEISADDLASLENAIKSKATPILEKIAEQFKITGKSYRNSDVQLEFDFSKKSFIRDIHYQKTGYDTYAKMLSVFDGVVTNAKGIEVHKDVYKETIREDPTLKYTYVLASAFADGENIIPVQMDIKVFNDKNNTLRLIVSFANKKKQRVMATGLDTNYQLPEATAVSDISIADLVKIVNPEDGDFLKYFPDSLLTEEQIEGKKKATEKQQEKIARLKQGIRSEAETPKTSKVPNTESSKDKATPERWKTERMKRTEGIDFSVKGLTEIISKMEHDFGIPISKGHIAEKNASGIYKRGPEAIRTKLENNLPTVSHELGHHLNKQFNLTEVSDTIKNELIAGADPEFIEKYKDEQKLSEAVSEFFRHYLQNAEMAEKTYPMFIGHLFSTVDAKTASLLTEYADIINAYYAEAAKTATSSIKLVEEKAADFRNLGEKVEDMKDLFLQSWVDSNNAIRSFTEEAKNRDAYLYATNAAYGESRATAMYEGDLYSIEGKPVGPGLKESIKGIDTTNKIEYKEFGEYLICKNGIERLAEGLDVWANEIQNTEEWMSNRIKELESKYPKFEEASEKLYSFQQSFLNEWGVKSGLVSEESAKSWGERWEYYVPFNRKQEIVSKSSKKKNAAESTIKKAKGSKKDFQHPIDNIMFNMQKMVSAALTNRVRTTIADQANNAEGLGWLIEKIPTPVISETFNVEGLVKELNDGFTANLETQGDVEKAYELLNKVLGNGKIEKYSRGKPGGDIITILRNGKPEFYQVHDASLLQSLVDIEPTAPGAIGKFIKAANSVLVTFATGGNISWNIFSNMPRDAGTVITYQKKKDAIRILSGVLEAYYNKGKKTFGGNTNPIYNEYVAMGGTGGISRITADKKSMEEIRRKINSGKTYVNPLSAVWNFVEWLSDTIESGPRYAVYKLGREVYGLTPDEAFYTAMEATTNFRRGGTLAKTVNGYIPFFNAAIQGGSRFVRYFTGDDLAITNPSTYYSKTERAKAVATRVALFATASVIIGILTSLVNTKDDEAEEAYNRLSNYTKNNYFVIYMGDGKFFAIPKPREIAAGISTTERLYSSIKTEDSHAFDDFYEYITDTFFPPFIQGIMQADTNGAINAFGVIGTVSSLNANKDYMGRPIVSQSYEGLPKKEQYNGATSRLAYWLGQGAAKIGINDGEGLSPIQIDYALSNIFGFAWKHQKLVVPMDENQKDLSLGIKGKWIKDSNYSTDVTNRMYDTKDSLSRKSKANPQDKAVKAELKDWSYYSGFYSTYSKLSRTEKETDETRATRDNVIDKIENKETEYETGNYNPVTEELLEIATKTGDTSVIPSAGNSSVDLPDDTEYNMNAKEYFEVETTAIDTRDNALKELIGNPDYENLSWKEKADVANTLKTYGQEFAREEHIPGYVSDNSTFIKMQALENNVEIKPEEYILWQIALDSVDKPNDNGNLGTYTQPENSEALGVFAEKVGLNPSDKEDELALAYLWQVATNGVSKNNPYGDALKGTPWYKKSSKDGQTWKNER